MSQSTSALEFILNTKLFIGLEITGIKYFAGGSVTADGGLPVLLTKNEMAHLQLMPNLISNGDRNAAIKERTFALNEEQRQHLQEYQLNNLPGFTAAQKTELVGIRNELTALLFEENKNKTDEEKALFDERKTAFFVSMSQFIYSLERNGVPREHAQKLEQLFPSILATTFYMGSWLALHQNVNQPMHDLCMAINFPTPPAPAFPTFRDWGPLHTNAMLADVKLLEKYTLYYPILLDKFGPKGLSTTSAEDFTSVIDRVVMLKELKGILPEGDTLSEVDEKIVKAVAQINLRFKNPKYKDVGRVLDVLHQAKNSDKYLPDISLQSSELGLFEGLSLRKLETYDPVAPLFGNFTGCCQRIGAQGETCAIHSVTSDKGGVYVLEWEKAILAGSWAWYCSDKHTLCFDSVEIDKQTRLKLAPKLIELGFDEETLSVEDLINVMYTEFAQRLMAANLQIQQVLVGTNGQTPAEIGRSAQSRFNMLLVSPDDYPKSGYRDSRTVRVLGRKDEVMYQLNALNKTEIIEKSFKDKKTSSQDFFKIFACLLDDNELLNEYFIGNYTHIKTVDSLPEPDDMDAETIYLIKDKNSNNLNAYYHVEKGVPDFWAQKTFSAKSLSKNPTLEDLYQKGRHTPIKTVTELPSRLVLEKENVYLIRGAGNQVMTYAHVKDGTDPDRFEHKVIAADNLPPGDSVDELFSKYKSQSIVENLPEPSERNRNIIYLTKAESSEMVAHMYVKGKNGATDRIEKSTIPTDKLPLDLSNNKNYKQYKQTKTVDSLPSQEEWEADTIYLVKRESTDMIAHFYSAGIPAAQWAQKTIPEDKLPPKGPLDEIFNNKHYEQRKIVTTLPYVEDWEEDTLYLVMDANHSMTAHYHVQGTDPDVWEQQILAADKLPTHYVTDELLERNKHRYEQTEVVESLPEPADRKEDTLYLIKGPNNELMAHFFVEEALRSAWYTQSIATAQLPNSYSMDEFIDENNHLYTTIEFFEKVTSLCGLPASRIKASGLEVPPWFRFVFNNGIGKEYSKTEIRELAALINEPGFIVPGTSETLVYAALIRWDFETVRALMPIPPQIIDKGNEEESCLVRCAKHLSMSLPEKDWYKIAINFLDQGGNPNYGDVNGDGFAHHVCKSFYKLSDLHQFMVLANKYQFDLRLPNDDGLTPLHFIAHNARVNTLATVDVDVLITEFVGGRDHHRLDYLGFSNKLTINDDAADLDALQNYLSTLTFSQVNHERANNFFANPSICQKAKVLLFTQILALLDIEKEKDSSVRSDSTPFKGPLNLETYLRAMTIKNVKEYEQFQGLFESSGMTCDKSFYVFYKTLEFDGDHLIQLQEYMKKNPPTYLELKQLTEYVLRQAKVNPQAKSFLLLMLEPQLKSTDKEAFLLHFFSHVNNENGKQHQDAISSVCECFDLKELSEYSKDSRNSFDAMQIALIVKRRLPALGDDGKFKLLTDRTLFNLERGENGFMKYGAVLKEFRAANLLSPALEKRIAVDLFEHYNPPSQALVSLLLTILNEPIYPHNLESIEIINRLNFQVIDPELFKTLISDKSKPFVDLCVFNKKIGTSTDDIQCPDLSQQDIDEELLFQWMVMSGNLDFYSKHNFLNGFKNEDSLCKSYMAYLQSNKFSSPDSIARIHFIYEKRIKTMHNSLTQSGLQLMAQLYSEQCKQPREQNDYSRYLWWYCIKALGGTASEQPDFDKMDLLIKEIKGMDASVLRALKEKFTLPNAQMVSITDFEKLETLCFTAEFFSKTSELHTNALERTFYGELSNRFSQNKIVLEEHIFDAVIERYQVDVQCLNHGDTNLFFKNALTNLLLRSALSSSEKRCGDIRKVLEHTSVWSSDVTLESFKQIFAEEYYFPPLSSIELSVNLYLLAAQSKEERAERCNLLLDTFAKIGETIDDELKYRLKPLNLLRERIDSYLQKFSQQQYAGTNSFFKLPPEMQKNQGHVEDNAPKRN